MIRANIEINQNKLEEFMRVLLPEHYDILSENSEKDVKISVNFEKSQDVENSKIQKVRIQKQLL